MRSVARNRTRSLLVNHLPRYRQKKRGNTCKTSDKGEQRQTIANSQVQINENLQESAILIKDYFGQ